MRAAAAARAARRAARRVAVAARGWVVLLSAGCFLFARAQSYSHYIENYPLEHPVLGFVSYSFILDLGCVGGAARAVPRFRNPASR